jgi:hypothetical protein
VDQIESESESGYRREKAEGLPLTRAMLAKAEANERGEPPDYVPAGDEVESERTKATEEDERPEPAKDVDASDPLPGTPQRDL